MKELAPSVWQLRGLPLNAINIYVIEDVLIDAGSKWATRRILRQVKDHEISLVALTHVHPDHQGAAKAVCERLGASLACHVDDVDSMEGRAPVQRHRPGHPINRLSRICFAGPPHGVDHPIREGEVIGGFKVIHAPGHAPGEVIYFRESDRVAISGDVINTMSLLTAIPGLHEAPRFFTYDLEESRRSIVKLLDLNPSMICPGHGPPLRDMAKLKRFVERHGLREAVANGTGP